MKEYVLSYYSEFKCKASECKHTCCAGWDMCIDENTLNLYKNNTSNFAKTLNNGIDFKKSKFKTDKNGRCAFLNKDGLCDLITNLGEQSLCQICRDHPRFKCFYDNVQETGLGFCCEQATKIILSHKDKITAVLIKDDESEFKPSFVQEQVLKFRQQALSIIQDRTKSINQRINELLSLCKANVNQNNFAKILKLFRSLERLDKTWYKRLKNLKKQEILVDISQVVSIECEQFLANSFYRHLAQAEDTLWARAITIACVFSWWIIYGIYCGENSNGDGEETLCDIVRDYSCEVEYSITNLQKLFSFARKFINL